MSAQHLLLENVRIAKHHLHDLNRSHNCNNVHGHVVLCILTTLPLYPLWILLVNPTIRSANISAFLLCEYLVPTIVWSSCWLQIDTQRINLTGFQKRKRESFSNISNTRLILCVAFVLNPNKIYKSYYCNGLKKNLLYYISKENCDDYHISVHLMKINTFKYYFLVKWFRRCFIWWLFCIKDVVLCS